jgi:hypothetical protein
LRSKRRNRPAFAGEDEGKGENEEEEVVVCFHENMKWTIMDEMKTVAAVSSEDFQIFILTAKDAKGAKD